MVRLTILATVALAASSLAGSEAADDRANVPAPSTEDVTASGLIQEYNSRPIGSPGLRRVRLEMRNDGQVTRTFDILHAWQRGPGEVRSLVLLESPDGLRGTNYLLVEDERLRLGVDVFLYLPAGQRRVLRIVPSRFDEGLLGSDFGYNDLLWQLPTAGRRLSLKGQQAWESGTVWEVEAEPVAAAARERTRWGFIRYYLSREPTLLVGADYFVDRTESDRGVAPAKQLRVSGWTPRQGVWTPDRMVMTGGPGRDSVLTLTSAPSVMPPVFSGRLVPEALPELGRSLEEDRLEVEIEGAGS